MNIYSNSYIELGMTCKGATIFWKNVVLITNDNEMIMLTASLDGWYESFGVDFGDEELLKVNFVNGQLIASTSSKLFIF